MTWVLVSTALVVSGISPVKAEQPAQRTATICVSDPATCSPPPTTPWDRLPPGTHCPELLPYAMEAGIEPEDAQWYLNVAFGESHCEADPPHNYPGMLGAMQIHAPSWAKRCGTTAVGLLDPTTTFRCAQVIEGLAGRRQWSPHNVVTGLFPGQT